MTKKAEESIEFSLPWGNQQDLLERVSGARGSSRFGLKIERLQQARGATPYGNIFNLDGGATATTYGDGEVGAGPLDGEVQAIPCLCSIETWKLARFVSHLLSRWEPHELTRNPQDVESQTSLQPRLAQSADS